MPVGISVRFANALNAEDKQRKEEGTLCTRCGGTGYQGVGTYELMKVNRTIREAIKQEKSTHEIESIAKENGMLTLNLCCRLIAKQQFLNCRKSVILMSKTLANQNEPMSLARQIADGYQSRIV